RGKQASYDRGGDAVQINLAERAADLVGFEQASGEPFDNGVACDDRARTQALVTLTADLAVAFGDHIIGNMKVKFVVGPAIEAFDGSARSGQQERPGNGGAVVQDSP